MVIVLLLGIVFSVRAFIVLLLYAITLRDILIFRMKGFTQVWFFNILSDTLIILFVTVGHPIRTSLSVRRA